MLFRSYAGDGMGEQVAAGSIKNITEAKAAVRTVPDAEVVHIEGRKLPPSTAGHAVIIDHFLSVI